MVQHQNQFEGDAICEVLVSCPFCDGHLSTDLLRDTQTCPRCELDRSISADVWGPMGEDLIARHEDPAPLRREDVSDALIYETVEGDAAARAKVEESIGRRWAAVEVAGHVFTRQEAEAACARERARRGDDEGN